MAMRESFQAVNLYRAARVFVWQLVELGVSRGALPGVGSSPTDRTDCRAPAMPIA